jgi:hypothetical protein
VDFCLTIFNGQSAGFQKRKKGKIRIDPFLYNVFLITPVDKEKGRQMPPFFVIWLSLGANFI